MHTISPRGVWIAALGALAVSLAAAALASANPHKPYSVALTGDVAASGSTVTAKFVNETATLRLGSADLTAPAGYSLSNASASQGFANVDGNVVELRNLALKPGQSLTVTIHVASATCSTKKWAVVAKQSNNFNGQPGNNLTLDAARSHLSTGVCAQPCKDNATCTTDAGNADGDASVVAFKADNEGQLIESVDPSTLVRLTCKNPGGSVYSSADRNTYGVFATVHRRKVVTITIANPAISIPLSQQQVCFDAPYKFGTVVGAPLLPDGNGGYIGLLRKCPADSDSAARPRGSALGSTTTSVGPCHDGDDDTEMGSTVVLVVNIPSGLPGDPHMS